MAEKTVVSLDSVGRIIAKKRDEEK
jgi:hypothetical protein